MTLPNTKNATKCKNVVITSGISGYSIDLGTGIAHFQRKEPTIASHPALRAHEIIIAALCDHILAANSLPLEE
jgi:hypothetical protein